MDALVETLPVHVRADPVIAEVKQAIVALYGDRLHRLLLYGSRARGDSHEDSDYEFLVLLNGELDRRRENVRIMDAVLEIECEHVVGIAAFARPARDLEDGSYLMKTILAEGADL